jgi:hypothetical protein
MTAWIVAGDHNVYRIPRSLTKRRLKMDKIIILTNSSEKSGMLVSCLHMLFPECEIELQSREMAHYRDVSGKPVWDTEGGKMKSIIDNRNFKGMSDGKSKTKTYN